MECVLQAWLRYIARKNYRRLRFFKDVVQCDATFDIRNYLHPERTHIWDSDGLIDDLFIMDREQGTNDGFVII